jgi:hypothetical protein
LLWLFVLAVALGLLAVLAVALGVLPVLAVALGLLYACCSLLLACLLLALGFEFRTWFQTDSTLFGSCLSVSMFCFWLNFC